jgi:hypothetical protein
VGYASAGVHCAECVPGPRLGAAATWLTLGANLSPHLALGLGGHLWTHRASGHWEDLYHVMPLVSWRPVRGPRLSLTGGAGLAAYSIVTGSEAEPGVQGIGWGVALALGYDAPVGRRLTLTPTVRYLISRIGGMEAGGAVFLTGWTQDLLGGGVELRFH